MSKFTTLLMVIFLSSGAFAANKESKPAEDEASAENKASTEKEELICTKVPVTGSHMKIKTCRTKAQAKDERDRARAFIERTRIQPLTEGNKG